MKKETQDKVISFLKEFENRIGAGLKDLWKIFVIRYIALGIGYIFMIVAAMGGCFYLKSMIPELAFIIMFSIVLFSSVALIPVIIQYLVASQYSALEKAFEKVNEFMDKN